MQIDEAVEMLEHVVKVQGKLAEDHPDQLVSQHALVRAYHADGQEAFAVELLSHVVAAKQRKLRVDHPSTNVSEQLLAHILTESRLAGDVPPVNT